jgi:hypothetical protein
MAMFRRKASASGAPLLPFLAFAERIGVELFDWQRDAFGAATARDSGRFVRPIAGVSVPRGNGKSYAAAAVGVWRLAGWSGRCHVLACALDLEGAKVTFDHARTIVRSYPALDEAVEVRASELALKATGSRWTITSREHTKSRGQHPDLIIYDEAGWSRDDELFASLLAGQASAPDPLMLVTSTVGRRQSGPLWRVKALAEAGDASVFWYWTGENGSPKVTRDFLERQARILLPQQFAREHQNQWIESADSFTSAADVDAAMSEGWTEQYQGHAGRSYVMFVDLGAINDPSVICVGHRDADRVFIDRLCTFQGSRQEPVILQAVERTIADLARAFKPMTTIRIESWQGLSAVQSLQRLGLPVEIFTPTAKAHCEEWPVLAQLLSTRRLVLYPHARLREELLGLLYEAGPTGVKVTDRGSVHQDHAVAVRGVCASLMAGVELGPLDEHIMQLNAAAPSTVEHGLSTLYGGRANQQGSLGAAAYGPRSYWGDPFSGR